MGERKCYQTEHRQKHLCRIFKALRQPIRAMWHTQTNQNRRVKSAQVLDISLEKKQALVPRIQQLKIECIRSLDIAFYLTKSKLLYHAFSCRKLTCIRSLSKSSLQVLKTICLLGIWLASGAYHMSPIDSLYVKSDISLRNVIVHSQCSCVASKQPHYHSSRVAL